jgi:hypothetical protein
MKNMKKLSGRVVNEIASLETSIDNSFVTLEDKINLRAGITDPGESIGTMQHCGFTLAGGGGNSPQCNWAVYRTQNGIGYADTPFGQPDVPPDALTQLLQELSDMVGQEGDYFKTAFTQIKEQVADQFPLLTPAQVIQRIMGIVADLVTKTARNFIGKLLDVVKIDITGLLDLLDAPLNIPILSPLYKLIAGSDLTFLDLFCLIGAIPATIVYKLIAGETPYPDENYTSALINASDYTALNFARQESVRKLQEETSLAEADCAVKVQSAHRTPIEVASIVLDIGAFFGSATIAVLAIEREVILMCPDQSCSVQQPPTCCARRQTIPEPG